MNKTRLMSFAFALLLALSGSAVHAQTDAPQVPFWTTFDLATSKTIRITESGFDPPTVTVFGPSDVTWINNTTITHTLQSGEPKPVSNSNIFVPLVQRGSPSAVEAAAAYLPYLYRKALAAEFSAVLGPGQTFTYAFRTPGAYKYHLASLPTVTGELTLNGVALERTSPANGEGSVAVTRDTVLEFSGPLDPATVTPAAFSARAGTKTLDYRLNLSADKTRVTLFYKEVLPGSTRVRVSVDGSKLKDAQGNNVDVDGNGAAGGTALLEFDTLSLTVIPGTIVCGRVFASQLAVTASNVSVNTPLQGVVVSVDGLEDALRATTDVNGNFCLNPAPAGRFFVHVDGHAATNNLPAGVYYPTVGKAWQSIPGQQTSVGEIYLPLIPANTLQPVSAAADTQITFPDSVLQAHPEMAGVSILVPADSLYSDDGARGGKVGIAPVPPDRLPGELPEELKFPVVITVQTDGAGNFDTPAPVCFPNLPDPNTQEVLAAGAASALFSFNHDTGDWEMIGPMTVSDDGKLVCTNPGIGILAPGWHGQGSGSSGSGDGGGGPCDRSVRQSSETTSCARSAVICGFGMLTTVGACGCLFSAFGYVCMAACTGTFGLTSAACGDAIKDCSDDRPPPPPNGCPSSAFVHNDVGNSWVAPLEVADTFIDPIFELFQKTQPILNEITSLATTIQDGGGHPTDEQQVQMSALWTELDTISGGNFKDRLTQLITESRAENNVSSDVPPLAPPFYALMNDEGKIILRGRTEQNGTYRVTVGSRISYGMVYFYDPVAQAIGFAQLPQIEAGIEFDLPDYLLTINSRFLQDKDRDNLSDLAELIIGTDSNKSDTDDDDLPDGAEVEQGTDPLDGLSAIIGTVASADTPGTAVDVCVQDDLAVVADSATGVSLLNVFSGMNPTIIAQVDTPGNAQAVACAGKQVAVADGATGLAIIDVSVPTTATITHQVSLDGSAQAVAVAGGFAYVGTSTGQLVAVNMTDGAIVEQVALGKAVQDVAVNGDTLYALTQGTLFALPLGESPLRVSGSADSPGIIGAGNRRLRLFVGGGSAFTTHARGYNTFSLADPYHPTLVMAGTTPQFGWKQIVANGLGLGLAAVGPNSTDDGPHHISLYDVSDPTQTNLFITQFETPGLAAAVTIYNGQAYVADSEAGLQVINYLAYDNRGQPPGINLTTNFAAGRAEADAQLRVTANITDDVQVRNVQFYVDGSLVSTDGSFPFEQYLQVPTLEPARAEQTLSVSAAAFDTGGNRGASEVLTLTVVADATPPRVVKVTPGAMTFVGAGTVDRIAVTFNEPLQSTSLTNSSLQLFVAGADKMLGTADDVPVTGGAVALSGPITATLSFASALPPDKYRAVVAASVADVAGNPLAAAFAWTFEVVDSISSGETHSGEIVTPGEIDRYLFEGVAGQRMNAHMRRTSGGLKPEILVYRPDGTLVCDGRTTGDLAQAICTLDVTGTHTILVKDWDEEETGAYAVYLFLQQVYDPTNTRTIQSSQTLSHTIEPVGDLDVYTFEGIAGQRMNAHMRKTSGGLNPEILVYRPDGTLVCDGRTTGDLAQAICKLDVTGTHTILVKDWFEDEAGSYEVYLFLQQVYDPANIHAIQSGQTLSDTIEPVGDMDVYTFEGQSGDQLLIRMVGTLGTTLDPQFQVYRPNGSELCSDSSSGFLAEEICVLDANGKYTILVGDWFADQTGSYSLYLRRYTNPTDATPIAYEDIANGKVIYGVIDSAIEVNAYSFQGQAGDQVLIRTAPGLDSDLSPWFRVYRPDGSEVCSGTIEFLAEHTCTLDVNGTYHLLNGSYAEQVGTYVLYLRRLNDPANAIEITYGYSGTARIFPYITVDAYTFAGNISDTIEVSVTYPNNLNLGCSVYPIDNIHGFVWARSPKGNFLCENYSSELVTVDYNKCLYEHLLSASCTLEEAGTHAIFFGASAAGIYLSDETGDLAPGVYRIEIKKH